MATKTIAQLTTGTGINGNWLMELDDGAGGSWKQTVNSVGFQALETYLGVDLISGNILEFNTPNAFNFNNTSDINFGNSDELNFSNGLDINVNNGGVLALSPGGGVVLGSDLNCQGDNFFDNNLNFWCPNTNDNFTVLNGGGTPMFYVINDGANGLTGISNSAPAYTLDVSGDVNFSGSLLSNGTAGLSVTLPYAKSLSATGTLTFTNGILTGHT